jgi:PKD domain
MTKSTILITLSSVIAVSTGVIAYNHSPGKTQTLIDNKVWLQAARQTPTPTPQASPIGTSDATREPSIDELIKSIPDDIKEMQLCDIDEEIQFTPETGNAPLLVRFNARRSSAPCGKIVSWEWDFGDGTSGSGARVKHEYTKPGTYIVRVNLTDNKGYFNLANLDYLVVVQPGKGAGQPNITR